MCIQLGWKPKYGRFDVLPLVLQVNGEDPEDADVPPEPILEVPIAPRFTEGRLDNICCVQL